MKLKDYTEEQLQEELERRQYQKDEASISIEPDPGFDGSELVVQRSGSIVCFKSNGTRYRLSETELRHLSILVNIARHLGKKKTGDLKCTICLGYCP